MFEYSKQFQLFNNYVIAFILLKDAIKNRNTNNYLKYVEQFLLLSCIEDAELTEKFLQDCVLLIKKGIYSENLKKLEMPTIINDEELDKLFRIEVYMYDHFVYLANFFKMYLSTSYAWR